MKVTYLHLDGSYASQSIDSYVINFEYKLKGSKKADIEYDYSITGDLVGTVITNDNQDKDIWNRKFILLDNKSDKQINTDEILINKRIKIDYGYYNELARSYERTYGITIDSVLKVYFNITFSSNLGIGNSEKVNDYIELDIPITNTVTEIRENYEKNTTKDILIKNQNSNVARITCYVVGGAFIITAITIIIIKIMKNKKTPKDVYRSNINHIMKYYRDLIVTVNNEPNIANLNIMNIDLLEDLIDVAEQNKSNIIHYEVDKNKRSKLYVIVNDYVYVYIVTDDKLK